jgi:hypothetical protein
MDGIPRDLNIKTLNIMYYYPDVFKLVHDPPVHMMLPGLVSPPVLQEALFKGPGS